MGERRNDLVRCVAVGTLLVVGAAAAWLIAIAPWVLGFAGAVGVAVLWCVWLDRIQEAREAVPEPGPDGGSRTDPERRSVTNVSRAAVVLLMLLWGRTAVGAQTPAPPPSASPSAQGEAAPANPLEAWILVATFEGYYEWNANRPPDRINLLRAYDTRANVFGIQQAVLLIEKAPDVANGRRAGMRIDLQFGQATETVQGGAANEPRPDAYRHVWQAYGSYVFPLGQGVQVDFGKFASSLGYETNYAKDNNNFSRAYLFSFLPFYHTGLRTTIPVNDKLTLMYMLTNGIQQTEDFNNFKSNQVAAVIKPASKVMWTLNYYVGQEQPDGGEPDGPDGFFRVFDSYVAFAPTDRASFGLDLSRVTSAVIRGGAEGSLTGVGAYARYQIAAPAALALRYEWLDDDGGLFGGLPQVLQEMTVTAEHRFSDGFLARGEFRRDWSDTAFFPAHDLERRKGQNTVLGGLVWWMGNKKGPY
jgi:hypothetical protein